MEVTMKLNGTTVRGDVAPDTLLLDFVRDYGCLSVKRGCETAGCGLCTVLLDGKPVLQPRLHYECAGHGPRAH